MASEHALTSHLGLCGPEALALELRQFYSLLSTVQKLGHCQAGGELCWDQDLCCWAAASAALKLLQSNLLISGAAGAAGAVQALGVGQ